MTTSSAQAWLKTPTIAHRAWREGLLVSERAYAEHTQKLYISLFGRFCQWMAGEGLDLVRIKSLDIACFLDTLRGRDGGVAANRTQRTYVAELERVFGHLMALGMRENNPASKTLEMLRITTPLRPRSIHLALPDTRARYLASLRGRQAARMTPVEVQNCAMNLLMMDAGLTLKELQKLVLKHVAQVDASTITAPGHRLLSARLIPLTPEAKKWLKRWLALRTDLKLVSQAQYVAMREAGTPIAKGAVAARSGRSRVFVSFTGKLGRPLGMRSSGVVLDHLFSKGIYLSAQEAMLTGLNLTKEERCQIRNKGPQALRNMYCASLVARELPVGEIVDLMGLMRPDQVWAMQRELQAN